MQCLTKVFLIMNQIWNSINIMLCCEQDKEFTIIVILTRHDIWYTFSHFICMMQNDEMFSDCITAKELSQLFAWVMLFYCLQLFFCCETTQKAFAFYCLNITINYCQHVQQYTYTCIAFLVFFYRWIDGDR